ncbi:MAG: MerR family transcriptional regulator, partial [Candidatus Accumulibacter sp.]|nr:MerR family transcriptional regulator [Accumulibacter sp.]
MRIGELARLGDCEVETVRFYEREGLLDAPAREANGYRRYARAHLVQLNFIRHCRSLGIGLPEVRLLRRFQANSELACDEVNRLVDRQIARIHQQIESLRLL